MKIISFCILTCLVGLNAVELDNVVEDKNLTSINPIENHAVKFAIELGVKNNFWNPGLSGNVLNYDTEGLFLGFGKLKVKLYDSDVLVLDKYRTLESSPNQDDLLATFKENQKSTLDGMRISLHVMKAVNYIFDTEWLEGLNYEYDTRDFVGSATLLQNGVYWYGRTNNGVLNQDFALLEREDALSFKTKFTSHKLSYKFEDVLESIKGSYVSIGLFDEEWSKPTFVGDTGLNGELPVVFDANYYAQGVSGKVGMENSNYQIQAYVDYGLNNEMKIIQKDESYSQYNKDIDMYTLGLKADYRFSDVYSTDVFTTDIIVGARMQYNQIVQDGDIELDAETLYGVNSGIEIIF